MPIRDTYLLQHSETFDVSSKEDVVINLSLTKAPPTPNTMLVGQVLDRGKPVFGVTVQAFSYDYRPVAQTITDYQGNFHFIRELLPGEYYLVATADGYKTSQEYPVFLSSGEECYLTIKLTKSKLYDHGTVCGTIVDQCGQRVPHGKVVIFDYYNPTIIKAITNSTPEGDYLICGLRQGYYLMTAFKDCYQAPTIIPFGIAAGQILEINMWLYFWRI